MKTLNSANAQALAYTFATKLLIAGRSRETVATAKAAMAWAAPTASTQSQAFPIHTLWRSVSLNLHLPCPR